MLSRIGKQVIGFQNILWAFLYKNTQNVRDLPQIHCIQEMP